MDKNKRQTPFVNIGSSLLLVVFLLLCLVTFAVLAFSSARSDESFSQRIAARKAEYYEASNRAEELFSQIDQILDSAKEVPDFTEIDSVDADIHYDAEKETFSYQVPINEKQALDVVLALQEEGGCRIEKWQTVNTQKWEADDTLQLMPMP